MRADLNAILGVSMGGKQALSLVLRSHPANFSAVGVISGKLHGDNLEKLERFVKGWPPNLARRLSVYFHYRGKSGTDNKFYDSNACACTALGGELVSEGTGIQGDHNWGFWRPQISEFCGSDGRLRTTITSEAATSV
jgi:S-formylglutathione hydrolase FrmB